MAVGLYNSLLPSVLKDADCRCCPPPARSPSPCFDRFLERRISRCLAFFVLPLAIFHFSNTSLCRDAWDYPNLQATSCPKNYYLSAIKHDYHSWYEGMWQFPLSLILRFTYIDKKAFHEKHWFPQQQPKFIKGKQKDPCTTAYLVLQSCPTLNGQHPHFHFAGYLKAQRHEEAIDDSYWLPILCIFPSLVLSRGTVPIVQGSATNLQQIVFTSIKLTQSLINAVSTDE